MKNILIIAYFYPPLGGAGVQRSLKFAKYLSKMGYNVSVLTVDSRVDVMDKSMEAEASGKIKIYRAEASAGILERLIKSGSSKSSASVNIPRGPSRSSLVKRLKKYGINLAKKVVLSIYRLVNIPDEKKGWKKNAVELGCKIIEEQKIDVIYSTSAPYTSHLIGLELKNKYNIPWICDFRDSWVADPFAVYSTLAKYINGKLEKKVVEAADRVIAVSEPIISDFIERYVHTDKSKYSVITNGYDEEDFQAYDMNKKTEKYTITYNGTLYGNRTAKRIFKAVDNLISGGVLKRDEITLRFVGNNGRDAKEEIEEFSRQYPNVVQCINYLPHRESIKQIEDSTALLLLIEDGPGSEGIYTGKIFEYIRSGRIIIGAVPDGVARDLISETNTGFCCYPQNISEIEEAIMKGYMIWKEKLEPLKIDFEKVYTYEREELTRQLAKLIEEL
ncbi:glycosyltransferase [Clostridium thermarum]|uniref:glycosyltransferase n=1 Tax=Clostridium thermarum TaxID=1716543 RepID=UPI0013D2C90A|nr:glycosyltransferase [Clostridium thermarum]